MTMGLLIPAQNFTFTNLNAVTNSYPAWNSATNYISQLKERVTRAGQDYEVLISNINIDPFTDTTGRWGLIGSTGAFKLFDGIISERDPNGTNLRFKEIEPTFTSNAVAILGLDASQARMIVRNGSTIVYNQTVSLVDDSLVDDYWEYFFTPITRLTEYIFLDLPMYFGAEYDLKVTKENGTMPGLCGEIALGYSYDLGIALDGTGLGIVDYSTKEFDVFGNAKVVARPFVQSVNYQFAMQTNRARSIQQVVGSVRARAALYHTAASSEKLGTLVYGILQDFDISLAGAEVSIATLTVQGLT